MSLSSEFTQADEKGDGRSILAATADQSGLSDDVSDLGLEIL